MKKSFKSRLLGVRLSHSG